jgi:hypothetical protein
MVPRLPRLADRYFVVGQSYRLVEHNDRSMASHRHYFSLINEAFDNLPEGMAGQFQSAEHLRKYALIKAGYANERSVVCTSEAEANKVAAFIAPMDEYALVVVAGAVVRVFTAQSQSYRTMDKATFAASKEAVMGVLSDMIGVAVDSLKAQVNERQTA